MMAPKQVFMVVVLVPVLVFCADSGSKCNTPDGESATCVPLTSCPLLISAIVTKNASAIDFAKKSQCGYESEPLVCCGTKLSIQLQGTGSECTTPHGEKATCKPLEDCQPIYNGILSRNKTAIEFARRSQCGYDNGPLVCCGLQKVARTVSSFFPSRAVCGIGKPPQRIFYGGEITYVDEHPWMALLAYRNDDGSSAGFKCGGTLINQRYVLTAAHCVLIDVNAGFELDLVRLGEWRVSTALDCSDDVCADPMIDLKLEAVIPHEAYSRRQAHNDIALLRLERNVVFTDFVRPICLLPPGSAESSVGTRLTMVGWGATENSSSSDFKMKVELPVLPRSYCSQRIRQAVITEKHICAGAERGKDSCKGDSGGPLLGKFADVHDNGIEEWFQEGIVSYGLVCGAEGIPAVYTRVSMYIVWMVDNMKHF